VVVAVVLVAVVVAVAPLSPSVSPLVLGASPGVYPLVPGASPGVPVASARAYLPWCQPSVALSSSVLQQRGHSFWWRRWRIYLRLLLWLSKYPPSVSIGR
jgi:hypothetical protein